MLSGISQTEKDKYCMISLIYGIYKIKLSNKYNKTETESYIHKTNWWLPEGMGCGDE